MLIGHGNGSRILAKIEEIEAGNFVDLDFWRMKNDASFANVVFRVQRGVPEATKPELTKTLKALYGKGLKDTYFLSMWVKAHDRKLTKVSKGTMTAKGRIPVGYSKDDIVAHLRCLLSSPVIVK